MIALSLIIHRFLHRAKLFEHFLHEVTWVKFKGANFLFNSFYFVFSFFKLAECQPYCEDETMVPVLTSKRASELPVNEVACVLQVCLFVCDCLGGL